MGRRAASRRSIFGCFRMVCQFNDDPSPPHRICHACARARVVVAGGGKVIWFACRVSGRGGSLSGAQVGCFANDSETKARKRRPVGFRPIAVVDVVLPRRRAWGRIVPRMILGHAAHVQPHTPSLCPRLRGDTTEVEVTAFHHNQSFWVANRDGWTCSPAKAEPRLALRLRGDKVGVERLCFRTTGCSASRAIWQIRCPSSPRPLCLCAKKSASPQGATRRPIPCD